MSRFSGDGCEADAFMNAAWLNCEMSDGCVADAFMNAAWLNCRMSDGCVADVRRMRNRCGKEFYVRQFNRRHFGNHIFYLFLDTADRKEEVRQMYESPLENIDLFGKYNVTYAVVSPYEQDSFSVDEFAYKQNFTKLFSYGDTVLYLIK